jgi:methionine-rich copper-binding protein CopC
MKRRVVRSVFAVLLTGLLVAGATGSASAHANLVGCNIKNYQVFHVAHAPHHIVATFAEELDPAKSWMAVFEGVADHGLVTDKTKSVVSFSHPKVMTLKLPRLIPDKYYMIWYTHSAQDGHYAAGIVYFSVRK